jgi:hypothetical protein
MEMAKDRTGNQSGGSEFDKFVSQNISKAIIGTPTEDGGVRAIQSNQVPNVSATNNPIAQNSHNNSPNASIPMQIELPAGMTAAQAAAIQAIINGQSVQSVGNPVAQPPAGYARDAVVPEQNSRMWNPMQPFVPTARLSDMERNAPAGANNPSNIIVNARVESKLNPKPDCPVVLIDAFNLFNDILGGRWLLPGCPRSHDVQTMLTRLRSEIENT